MPDTDAADEPTPDDASGPTAALGELQRLDTEIDQLTHQRGRLPESDALREAKEQLASWEAERGRLTGRINELTRQIAGAEERSAEIGAHTARLEAQLKTVIAPREAEALMQEISVLADERDAVETAELEALEAQTTLEGQLEAHLSSEGELRDAAASAAEAEASAIAAIDTDVAALTGRRDSARQAVDASVLGRYDRLRSHHLVAVADLVGSRCSGCHLDLSAAEVDEARDEAAQAGGVATCPQCGRMLVV